MDYEKYNEKLDCVIGNLEEITVVEGKPYDKGAMTECKNTSEGIIQDYEETIVECQKNR